MIRSRMMSFRRLWGPLAIILVAIGLSACANVPSVDYKYVPAVGVVNILVVQSLACSRDDSRLVISSAPPTITPSYQAQASGDSWHVLISKDATGMADTDFTMSWYDGGRLKGVNSTSTGQAETVLKDVVSIAGAPVLVGSKPGQKAPPKLLVCTELKNLSKDGVIAVTYSGQFLLGDFNDAQKPLPPANGSADVFNALDKLQHIGPMGVTLTRLAFDTTPAVPVVNDSERDGYFWLPLQKVEFGTLTVLDQQGNPLGAARISVPSAELKDAWSLPIPKPQPFGKSTFALSVAESGMVTSLEYARNAGSPGVFNVFSAAATAATPKDKLAELKAQDDLIAENNRHALCVAQPDQCK